MSNIPKVIGEGTYGCVHNPPLLCDGSTTRDNEKVSKLMDPREASKEMKEYVLIDKIDKKKLFYLGEPDNCKAGLQESNKKAIKQCQMSRDINIDRGYDLELLLMRNGGLNLTDFSENFKKKPVTKENKDKIEEFWLEGHRLFMGLKAFAKKNILHHDLKAGNIVYLEATNRLNYIDFGLMNTKSNLKKISRENRNRFAAPHWSFPPEMEFLSKRLFDIVSTNSEEKKRTYVTNIGKGFNTSTNKSAIAIKTFYSVVNMKPKTFNIPDVGKYLGGFLRTMKHIDNKDMYEDFLDKSLSTIDTYGLACGLMETLCNLYKFMEMDFVKELAAVLYLMLDSDITKRVAIHESTDLYEECLRKHILKNRKQQFKQHKIVNETVTSTVFDKQVASLTQASIAITSKKELKKLMVSPSCPDGKEINPNTGRCIFNCKVGYIRDKKFKCTRKKRTNSECPEGKRLNPKTNRCNKKPITMKKKQCAEGKRLNPKTNRCVKI